MPYERVNRPLGRIAEILVESGAKVGLNEIRDLLEALDDAAYTAGFADGQQSADDGANESAVRSYEKWFGDHACGG